MRVSVVHFVDTTNVDWSVSEQPSGFGGLRDWDRRRLRFESVRGVRYFRPVPENWQTLSPRILESLCALADLAETAA